MALDVTRRPVRRPSDRGKAGINWQPGMDRQNPPGGGTAYTAGSLATIEVEVAGPWFDPGFRQKIAGLIEDIRYRVAAQTLAEVQLNLDRSIQHPTPYYETQVMVQRQADDWVVHDRGIIYGPWLEGTSHRNQTTRFKGYASFRRAADEMRRNRAPQLVQWTVDRFMAEVT